MFTYREVINISSCCLMVVGRHLNVQRGEADVANALIYKHQNKLYIIDTGALVEFKQTLHECCSSLQPYEEVILINTHGHGDHVGNNCLIDELQVAKKSHFVSAHDLVMMKDNQSFFEKDFLSIEPFLLAEGKTAKGHLEKLIKLFEPLNVLSEHLATFETLATQDIKIGNIHWSGWNINDAVYVMKSQGHSAGHVVVYIPELQHIHMGDETNGYCNLFHDCDHLKSLESHTKTLSMLEEGTVKSMTDGHTFELHQSEQAIERLSSLIDGHYVFGNEIRSWLANSSNGLLFEEIFQKAEQSKVINALPVGANPNATYLKLQLLSKCKDLGIVADQADILTARFNFIY